MTDAPPKIDCHEAADRLYDYLDRELTPEVEAAVRAHLVDCAMCFQLFDFETAYLRFLEVRTRTQGAPPALKRRILDSLLCEGGDPGPQ